MTKETGLRMVAMLKKNIKNALSGPSCWMYIAILVILSFALYWRTLNFGFVLDDYYEVRGYSLREIISIFCSGWDSTGIGPKFYRPLVVISYALNHLFFKANPFGYHLTSIILNMINVILVYFVMIKIGGRPISGFVTAVLFLLMPYNAFSASWISHRYDVVMAIFYLGSFLAFASFYNNANRKYSLYYFSILCYIFALMSKEMAVTLAFVILLYSYLESKKLEIKLIMPYFVILCSYMIFRFLIFKEIGGFTAMFPLYEAIPLNLSLAFLRAFIPFSYMNPYYLVIYLLLFFILIYFGAIYFKSFKNKNKIFFAFFWICLTILPLYTIARSRLLYLPSIGFAMLLSLTCLKLYQNNVKYAVIFIIGLCFMLAVVNIKYQNTFFSPTNTMVLDSEKGMYALYYNKLDKEPLAILEQKLQRYGLLNEAKDLMGRGGKNDESGDQMRTLGTYMKELYAQGRWRGIFKKVFSAPI